MFTVAFVAAGLLAFGALVGRRWALAIPAAPFVLVALMFTLSGTIEDHDGNFEGWTLGLAVAIAGAVVLAVTGIGVVAGQVLRERRSGGSRG